MGLEFNEEKEFNKSFETGPEPTSIFTKWIIKAKLAKDEKQAKLVMSIITIVCFALAIFFALK
ncbi:MAG: hypothetical protein WC827_02330 [Candidatus Paceibacterota bacterium]|jgi:hypothetical protein